MFTNKSSRLSQVILLIGVTFSIAWSLYFEKSILATPYEIGYREGAPQVITQMMIDGKNFSTFEYQPLGYNAYGLGYHLVVLPFALIFGNTLHVHRLISFIFILLSAAISFWIVFQQKRNFLIAAICSAFIMVALMGWGGLGSAPTTMGAFLFLTATFIPVLFSFEDKSLIASAVLAVFAFYTKAYFVLSFGIVAAYLFLFVSKKKAINYGLSFLVPFVLLFVAIRISYPLYFINVILGNASNTFRTFEHLYTQLFWLTVYFFPTLVLAGIMLWRSINKKNNTPESKKFALNFFDLSSPLLKTRPDYFLHAFIICLFVFVFVLGSHVGNYLAYSYELVIPTFLFWFLINFEKKQTFTAFSTTILVINLLYWQYITLNPQMLDQKSSIGWERVFSAIKPNLKILNSPTVASRMIELGMMPVDSGQTDVYYLMDPYPNNIIMGPSYEEYYKDGIEYTNSINASISQKEYDLIITTKDVDVFYDLDLIYQNYKMTDELILYMVATNQKWVVQIWEPK